MFEPSGSVVVFESPWSVIPVKVPWSVIPIESLRSVVVFKPAGTVITVESAGSVATVAEPVLSPIATEFAWLAVIVGFVESVFVLAVGPEFPGLLFPFLSG